MIRSLAVIVVLAGSLVALSCQTGSPAPPPSDGRESTPEGHATPTPSDTPVPREQPTSTPAGGPMGTPSPPGQPTPSMGPGQVEAGQLALHQLSRDKGIPPERIRVVTVEEAEWRDTSLGCPAPGQMYAQVITPGYRVLLTADGVTYEYHTEGTRRAVLCER